MKGREATLVNRDINGDIIYVARGHILHNSGSRLRKEPSLLVKGLKSLFPTAQETLKDYVARNYPWRRRDFIYLFF